MPWLSHQSLRILKYFMEHPRAELAGAELIREVGLLSGTVYPILIRFERRGLVTSKWEESEPSVLGRPRRRMYRLTGEGHRVAREALADLRTLDAPLPAAAKA